MPRHTEKITVVLGSGPHPPMYLVGPPCFPFADLAGNGPLLATIPPTNPNAKGDALLYAASPRLKQLLSDLVDAINDGNGVTRRALVHESVTELAKLDAE